VSPTGSGLVHDIGLSTEHIPFREWRRTGDVLGRRPTFYCLPIDFDSSFPLTYSLMEQKQPLQGRMEYAHL